MREVKVYTFRALIKGIEQQVSGKGTNQFEADNDATIKVMRETGAKFKEVEILEALSIVPTDEWI
ncbi:hypothetical protein [Brevibacillus choshinensis]|uniref:hypothetical protein n=1 Tax=Brevibacillus choshinensis TaxID=54911 RepID=UPI002E227E77|nr:hypothetical protein [Brevibacillus choshinensis]